VAPARKVSAPGPLMSVLLARWVERGERRGLAPGYRDANQPSRASVYDWRQGVRNARQ